MQKTTQISFYNSYFLIWLGVVIATLASTKSAQAVQIHFSSDRNSFDFQSDDSLELADVATDLEHSPAGNSSNLLQIASTRGININANVDNSSSISALIPRLIVQRRKTNNSAIAANFVAGDFVVASRLSPQASFAIEGNDSFNDLVGKKTRFFAPDILQDSFSLVGNTSSASRNNSAILSSASSQKLKISSNNSRVESLSSSSDPVPEPLTIFGTLLAGGIGFVMKKRQN